MVASTKMAQVACPVCLGVRECRTHTCTPFCGGNQPRYFVAPGHEACGMRRAHVAAHCRGAARPSAGCAWPVEASVLVRVCSCPVGVAWLHLRSGRARGTRGALRAAGRMYRIRAGSVSIGPAVSCCAEESGAAEMFSLDIPPGTDIIRQPTENVWRGPVCV